MGKSSIKTFEATLVRLRSGLGWVIAPIPFDIAQAWPRRKGLRVRGEIEGLAFRTALFARAGGGHFLLVNKKMQAAAQAGIGSRVKIRLEPDLEEREAVVSPELAQALKGDRRLRAWFDGLGVARRRDIGKWVTEPKSKASRQKRAEQIAEWLLLTLEGEKETPPILKAAFLRQPPAAEGWDAMSATRRRNHLLGIFHLQSGEARQRRVAAAVEDALHVALKVKGLLE